jgi:hypothetical protein
LIGIRWIVTLPLRCLFESDTHAGSRRIGFKFYISAGRATEISGGCEQEWLGKLQLTLCISINKSFCNS